MSRPGGDPPEPGREPATESAPGTARAAQGPAAGSASSTPGTSEQPARGAPGAVPASEPMRPVAGRGSDATKLARAQALRAADAQALDRVRAAAGKWQAGLAGLLAVVTGVSVASMGTEVRALSPGPAAVAAVLVALSLGLAVAAVLASLRASGGQPRVLASSEVLAGDLDHADAVDAIALLRRAIRLAIAAITVYAAAVGVTWFGDRDPSDPTTVTIEGPVEVEQP